LFLSLVRPERISSPMTRRAAVTVASRVPGIGSGLSGPLDSMFGATAREAPVLSHLKEPGTPGGLTGARPTCRSRHAPGPDRPLRRRAPPALHELPHRAALLGGGGAGRLRVMARRDPGGRARVALSPHPVLPAYVLVLRLQHHGHPAPRAGRRLCRRALARDRNGPRAARLSAC